MDLARRRARVILACRNKEKAEAAAYDIRRVKSCHGVMIKSWLNHGFGGVRCNIL